MLKIRVIGTKNEIAWFQNLVRNHLQIEVLDMSKYSLQGTTQGRYLTGGVPPVRFSM